MTSFNKEETKEVTNETPEIGFDKEEVTPEQADLKNKLDKFYEIANNMGNVQEEDIDQKSDSQQILSQQEQESRNGTAPSNLSEGP